MDSAVLSDGLLGVNLRRRSGQTEVKVLSFVFRFKRNLLSRERLLHALAAAPPFRRDALEQSNEFVLPAEAIKPWIYLKPDQWRGAV
jgi:hypothetical protein